MAAGKRDDSRDGFGNKVQTFVLTHFRILSRIVERIGPLRRWRNKTLINSAILTVPARPYPFSTWGPYTSWEALTVVRWAPRRQQVPKTPGGSRCEHPASG